VLGMTDPTVTTAPAPKVTLGRAAAFLIRRVIAAAHAAVLLSILLATTAALVIARVAVAAFLALAAVAARAFDVLRRVLRRRRAPAGRRWPAGRSASSLFGRSLPAVMAGAFTALRYAARRERRDIGAFCGRPIREAYRLVDNDARPGAATLLRDPATWRDLAYWSSAILTTLVAAGAIAAAWLAAPALASVIILAAVTVPSPSGAQVAPADWWTSLPLGDNALLIGLAVVLALLAPRITRAAASAYVAFGPALLGPGEQVRLQAELDEQRMRRRLMVEAAENERRRIERDLHDGAQQRLVSLAMTLGMARERFKTDADAAEQLVAEAHGEAKLALGELRTLARGIHPAVLTDRGLDAALSSLAARAGVPVEVDIRTARRLPATVESAAYFVVAEALTNATRHAAATRAKVSVVDQHDHAVVEISDDGVGGADPSKGTGLAGLAGRIDGIDGRMTIDSPEGGPTVIRAELPCAS
jgi:signal transduction histidine kinase